MLNNLFLKFIQNVNLDLCTIILSNANGGQIFESNVN